MYRVRSNTGPLRTTVERVTHAQHSCASACRWVGVWLVILTLCPSPVSTSTSSSRVSEFSGFVVLVMTRSLLLSSWLVGFGDGLVALAGRRPSRLWLANRAATAEIRCPREPL